MRYFHENSKRYGKCEKGKDGKKVKEKSAYLGFNDVNNIYLYIYIKEIERQIM